MTKVDTTAYEKKLVSLAEDLAHWSATKNGDDYESLRDEFVDSVSFYVESLRELAGGLAKRIDASGIPGVTVVAMPPSELPDDVTSGVFQVHLTKDLYFTVFYGKDELVVDDVLDAGDPDFFNARNLPQQKAYFDLVNDLRGVKKAPRTLTLYTARPTKDRATYDGADHLPANIFLTSSLDDAEGIGHDFGGRDIYRVRVSTQYLVQTLDTPTVKHYQTVERAPAEVTLASDGAPHTAALKDRKYLESLNLKALQKGRKPQEGQSAREFYQDLQDEAAYGPIFSEDVLHSIEKLPDLPKPVTTWLGSSAVDMDAITVDGLLTITKYVMHAAKPVLSGLSWDAALENATEWVEHGDDGGVYEKNKVVHKFSDGWKVVELETENDILLEGTLVQNCLRRPEMDWYGKVRSGETTLYSLRTPSNTPRVDIEVHGNDVKQVYGKQNQPPVQQYIPYLQEFFAKSDLASGFLILQLPVPLDLVPKLPEATRAKMAYSTKDAEVMAVLLHDPSVAVRKRLIPNPELSRDMLQQLVDDDDPNVSADAEMRVKHLAATDIAKTVIDMRDPKELAALADHESEYVRREIAKNTATPKATLLTLMSDSHVSASERAVGNYLRRFGDDDAFYTELAKSARMAMTIASDYEDDDLLGTVYKFHKGNAQVCRRLANNDNTPMGALKEMATHNDYNVRAAVAANANTPVTVVRSLLDDDDETVREVAEHALFMR